MKRFVIVVDTQRDFMLANGALSVTGAEGMIAAMDQWLGALDPAATAGVLFTFDTHRAETYDRSPEAEAFPPHCLRGTAGWENVLDPGSVDPAIPVWWIEKGVFDMWAEDGLTVEDARLPTTPAMPRDRFFADLLACGIQEVAVIGVAADYCVKWTVAGLIERGFTAMVPASLTCGIDKDIREVAAAAFASGSVWII